ncbi:unnamed protein product [Arctia plantaginis]|uniref:ABC transporter domain-containing protein n=1 Tax=Arctia plantaginis TaxID=874455 RepID=A0A8S1BA79_ARCPL|nr:unnamed protein product [Arctia plantaginis]
MEKQKFYRSGERNILHNVSGELRSGELTCILGHSGAGKSTLLNILAGYNSNGVTGRITVNGHLRDMCLFKKLSTYIMQDDLLQPRLSVQESMVIAADLKLGKELGKAEKLLIVEEILQTLGLWDHRNTMSERLSGGQLKRLSVALELVNNPPVIFLDEPTTGLDIVAIRHLVVLLRLLSRQGRNIVCTIHQPSASLFALFDKIFVLARGMCCYQGVPQLLVPFMAEAGYVCPTTHNPADFILETLVIDAESTAQLSELCMNGKLCRSLDRITARGGKKPILHSDESVQRIFVEHMSKEKIKMEYATSFWTQFCILSKRMFVQTTRNTTALWIQLAHHILSGLIIGSIFFKVGNNAGMPIVNFKFCLTCLVFFVYTHTMVPVLLFPLQVRLLRREYFNRWYGLKPYYAALTFSTLPTMFFFGMVFLATTYLMSGQLLEWDRFVLFSIAGIVISICSEGFGLAIGSAVSATNGSILAPALAAPLLALASYGLGFGSYIESSMKLLMSLSFLRYGVTSFSLALYQHRNYLDCPDPFCLYNDPRIILRDLGMQEHDYSMQILALLGFAVLHRLLGYLALKYRLTVEFSSRFMNYVGKVLKHR